MRTILKNLINYIHRGCQDRENSLRKTLEQLNRRIATLKEENRQKEEKIQTQIISQGYLKKNLSSKDRQLKELQERISERDNQIVSLTEDNNTKKSLLQKEREELKNSIQQISALQIQLQDELKNVSDGRQSILALQAQIQSQEDHIARTRQEVEELRTSLHCKEQEEVKLRTTIDTIEHEKDSLMVTLDLLNNKIESISEENHRKETQIQTQITTLTQEKLDLIEQLASANIQLKELQQRIAGQDKQASSSTKSDNVQKDLLQDYVEELDISYQEGATQQQQLYEERENTVNSTQTTIEKIPNEKPVDVVFVESQPPLWLNYIESKDKVDVLTQDSEDRLYVDLNATKGKEEETPLDTVHQTENDAEYRSQPIVIDRYESAHDKVSRPFDLSQLGKQFSDNTLVSVKDYDENNGNRTITEVLEVETGKHVSVEEILAKDRAELLLLRKLQQEAIMGLREPRYKCLECGEILNLAGESQIRGKVTHFQHTRRTREEINSGIRNCALRSANDANRLSRAEIDALKYSNSQGERHRLVKETLAELLQQTPDVNNLYVEKNVASEFEGFDWKRPDIQFEYKGRNIICELQISSTYLSVITERELFYRIKQSSVLWVFCFEEDSKQEEFESLFVRDIYYANRRNAFIFTKEAYEASKANNKLHLTCIWFEPHIDQGVYDPDQVVRRSKLVALEDLSFDTETHKPYYVDAEAMFVPYNRPFYNAYTYSYQLSMADIERAASVFLARRQARNELRLVRLQQAKAEQDEARELLANSDIQITLFQNRQGKWGYKVGDVVIEPPTYSNAELYPEEELVLLYKGRRYQFIDYKGVEVGPIFHQLFPILNNKCFIRIGKEYHLLELSSGLCRWTKYSAISLIEDMDYILKTTSSPWRGKYEEQYITADGATEFDNLERPFCNGIARAKRGGYWGGINSQGEIIIPFEYSMLNPFEYGIARAKKGGYREGYYWGCVNLQGKVVIPFEYSELNPFEDGIARAKKGDFWGYIDSRGNPVSERLEEVAPGVFRAKQFEKWGLQDESGKIICPFIYDEIMASQGGYITYKGEFRSNQTKRPKGTFTYVPLPSIEAQVLKAIVVNRVRYGIFISIRNMPATLIHKSTLNRSGITSQLPRGSKLNVIITGLNEKYRVVNVELVSVSS